MGNRWLLDQVLRVHVALLVKKEVSVREFWKNDMIFHLGMPRWHPQTILAEPGHVIQPSPVMPLLSQSNILGFLPTLCSFLPKHVDHESLITQHLLNLVGIVWLFQQFL